ncbi:MAG: ATP-binding protein [Pseudomonadota bacterium]
MSSVVLNFDEADFLGHVIAVDTSHVLISVENSKLFTQTSIGSLVSIHGNTEHEYLIALLDKATKILEETRLDIDPENKLDDEQREMRPADTIRATMIGTFREFDGERTNTFKRGTDSFPQIDRECFAINGANLQHFMGLLGAEFEEEERLKLGVFVADRTAEAIASGDKFFQRHAAILGSTGSGKSWAVALLLERASSLPYTNIVVFDMHGEYGSLCKGSAGFARQFKIAGPGDLGNPSTNTLFLPYWLLNREELLSMVLDRTDQNAPNQASRFTQHVRELKEETLALLEMEEAAKTFTVDSPIPYSLERLIKKLEADNTAKGKNPDTGREKNGEWNGKLTRFISRMNAKVEDRRYGFMFQPTPESIGYDWLPDRVVELMSVGKDSGIKIIDFSEVPADVLPVLTGTIARLLYDVQFWLAPEKRTPICILCDEAHLYLPARDDANVVQRQALGAFERIAKEGRKYGFSIVVVSQRPSDVSRTILSQCNNFLSLRLTNETDQNVVRRLVPDSLLSVADILPLLDTGEALLLGDAVLLPTRIKLDAPTVKPDSATRDFWREWGTLAPAEHPLRASVESLRRQTRV